MCEVCCNIMWHNPVSIALAIYLYSHVFLCLLIKIWSGNSISLIKSYITDWWNDFFMSVIWILVWVFAKVMMFSTMINIYLCFFVGFFCISLTNMELACNFLFFYISFHFYIYATVCLKLSSHFAIRRLAQVCVMNYLFFCAN